MGSPARPTGFREGMSPARRPRYFVTGPEKGLSGQRFCIDTRSEEAVVRQNRTLEGPLDEAGAPPFPPAAKPSPSSLRAVRPGDAVTHYASLFTLHFCFLLSQFLLFGGPGFGLQTSTVPSVRCWKVSKVRSDTGLGARGRGAKGAKRRRRQGQADEGKRRKPLRLLHLCA